MSASDNANSSTSSCDAVYARCVTEMSNGQMETTARQSTEKSLILDEDKYHSVDEAALLGITRAARDSDDGGGGGGGVAAGELLYMNVTAPFVAIAVGVQGSGKSHTMGVLLENCLLPSSVLHDDVSTLRTPMSCVVFHYDEGNSTICEAVGLLKSGMGGGGGPCVSTENAVVLVSPTYYHQRERFYRKYGVKCDIKPLLFSEESLTAKHLMHLMGFADNDTQLYRSILRTHLQDNNRNEVPLNLTKLRQELLRKLDADGFPMQKTALTQRFDLIEQFIAGNGKNKSLTSFGNIETEVRSGRLVIVDLSDPMISPDQVTGIFQTLLEQYRSKIVSNKCVMFDEAHKYMKEDTAKGLCASICEGVRLMRHEAIRMLISTQNPKMLTPELLELSSVVVMHRFHSREWFDHIKNKLGLSDSCFNDINQLDDGETLLFASRCAVSGASRTCVLPAKIRPRITKDLGVSVASNQKVVVVDDDENDDENDDDDVSEEHVVVTSPKLSFRAPPRVEESPSPSTSSQRSAGLIPTAQANLVFGPGLFSPSSNMSIPRHYPQTPGSPVYSPVGAPIRTVHATAKLRQTETPVGPSASTPSSSTTPPNVISKVSTQAATPRQPTAPVQVASSPKPQPQVIRGVDHSTPSQPNVNASPACASSSGPVISAGSQLNGGNRGAIANIINYMNTNGMTSFSSSQFGAITAAIGDSAREMPRNNRKGFLQRSGRFRLQEGEAGHTGEWIAVLIN